MPKRLTAQAAFDPRAKRESLKMNQSQFWNRIGVTQSAGSRYETGRVMPAPLVTVLTIAYGTDKQSEKAVKELRNVGC